MVMLVLPDCFSFRYSCFFFLCCFNSNRASPLKQSFWRLRCNLISCFFFFFFSRSEKWIEWWISLCFVKQILSFAVRASEWTKKDGKMRWKTFIKKKDWWMNKIAIIMALIEFQRVHFARCIRFYRFDRPPRNDKQIAMLRFSQ